MKKKKPQTFNDGVVKIYKVDNTSAPGDKPKDVLVNKHENIRYEERIVGMGRYWTGKQSNVQIDRLIRTPKFEDVSPQDIAIPNDGFQYEIKQVQYPPEIIPPVMDLSLQRLEQDYGVD